MDFKEFAEKKRSLELDIHKQIQDFVEQVETNIEVINIEICSHYKMGITKDTCSWIHLHIKI